MAANSRMEESGRGGVGKAGDGEEVNWGVLGAVGGDRSKAFVRQMVKGWGGEVRRVVGFGEGRVMSWGRKAVSTYTHLRSKKGALRGWKYKIGKDDSPQCSH